MTPNYFW